MPFQVSTRRKRFQPGNSAWMGKSEGIVDDEPVLPALPPVRLSKEMFDLTVGKEGSIPEGSPCLLRPAKHSKSGITEMIQECSDEVCGNRIISVSLLLSGFSDFTERHALHNQMNTTQCIPEFAFQGSKEVVRGLCVQEYIMCNKCKFSYGPYRLYEYAGRLNTVKGRLPGKMNVQLQTAMTKLSMGYNQVIFLFAGIEVPPPSVQNMVKLANRISDVCKDVNKKTMLENQTTVARVMEMRGHSIDKPFISAESDVAYNNPPKGRSMSQPGTQAYAPLIENVTDKKLVIAFSTASKHCATAVSLRKLGVSVECPHHEGKCSATWPENVPMGNVETALAKSNAAFLEHVQVDKLCTDNDSKLVNGTRQIFPGVEKMDCTVHASRGQRRRLFKHPFSDQLYARYKVISKSNVNQILSAAVAKRCTAELQQAKTCIGDDKGFLKKVTQAKENIIDCFGGRHGKCRRHSFICKGTRASLHSILSSLPEQKWLLLSEKDTIVLAELLEYKLSPTMIMRQRDLLNTNKSEATHLRVFKSLPKSNTWLRNYEGRAHSAIHSATLGAAQSLREINKVIGAPMNAKTDKILDKIDKRHRYLEDLRKTAKSKSHRKQNTRRKSHMKCAYNAGYKSGMMHPGVRNDHGYSCC